MKTLILKLGILLFAFLFMIGVWLDIPTPTLVFRSFVAFLAIETMLVLVAVIFIKMTEKHRREEFDEEEMEENGSSEERGEAAAVESREAA